MVMIVSILDDDILENIITEVENLIGSHIGVISVGDVEVIRNDRF